MAIGFYKSFESSDPQKFKIARGTQLLGVQDTPFYSNLTSITPDRALQGGAAAGIKWSFTIIPEAAKDGNAHLEGSAPAASEYWNANLSSNHFQIFKKTFGVSGSAIDDSVEGFLKQQTLAMIALRKDINKALIGNTAPVQRSATVEGKLGGLYSMFGTHNEVDAGGKPLSYDMLEDVMGLASLKGINIDTCYGNGNVLRSLNKILRENERGVIGDRVLSGQAYSKMTNFANTTRDVNIIKENMFAGNELILCVKDMLAVVLFRDDEYELPRTSDAKMKEMILELSFWYDNPYAAVRVKNLAV